MEKDSAGPRSGRAREPSSCATRLQMDRRLGRLRQLDLCLLPGQVPM